MIASDVMTPDPETVTPETTVSEACEPMRERAIRHLPVVKDGVLVGMLSDRDVVFVEVGRPLMEEGLNSARRRLVTPVIGVMSPDVLYVEPDTELAEAISLMLEGRVGAVPVVRPGTREVIGIVSYMDVLRAVQDRLEGI